jgi:thiol-disulfide isomerase/thioredoxin
MRFSIPRNFEFRWYYGVIGALAIMAVAAIVIALMPVAADRLEYFLDDGLDRFSMEYRGVQPPMAPIEASDGTRGDLSAFRGQVVLVNIWATWCPPCIVELPSLTRLHQKFADRDFQVIALSVDQNWQVIHDFHERHNLELPVFLDASGAELSQFEYFSLPTSILIDRDGNELGRQVGAALWDGERGTYLIKQALDGHL